MMMVLVVKLSHFFFPWIEMKIGSWGSSMAAVEFHLKFLAQKTSYFKFA